MTKVKYKANDMCMVWEPGMNEWLEMKYVGFNSLKKEHIFVSPDDNQIYMYMDDENIEDGVN